jgi:glycopeptide antibiotics resistance protein
VNLNKNYDKSKIVSLLLISHSFISIIIELTLCLTASNIQFFINNLNVIINDININYKNNRLINKWIEFIISFSLPVISSSYS